MRTRLRIYVGLLIVPLVTLSCTTTPSKVSPESDTTSNTHFYFVQLTDTHFGDEENDRRTEKAISSINNLPFDIEFVAVTGDLTCEKLQDRSVVSNCVSTLNRLSAPVYCLPGNHDILQQEHDATMQSYTNNFGKLISQQEYNGVVFLFVYTEPLAKAFSVPEYAPLKELHAKLKKAEGKPVIIFHHTPSVDDFYNNQMHAGWKNNIREQWGTLLNEYHVKAVIAGHFHRDEHHWLGNVPLYVSSAIAGYWGRQATYRIYEYKDGKISYRTQYIR